MEEGTPVIQPAEQEPMDTMTALQVVLKNANMCDGLARGLRECVKALDSKKAFLCVLAESCDEPAYTRLVEALCDEHKIQFIKVADGKQLGEWVGLCKYDEAGEARKIVNCSCVAVKDFGEKTPALDVLLAHFNNSEE
eukprot:TRINITY_DN9988_c0_g1_i1.p2 TRINITY_DN9988_c0_g1~~TRINITY_DN9988_c0_g1_i1.p2  ORF type:complete len:138 (-),score=62.48 TRINITY_DN9988_c0_g1_i1:183-596(-)